MTGNLNMLVQFRDLRAAEDVKKKAELGWFDVEFTMYGCAYLSPVDHKMYYKVSPNAQDIYDFIDVATATGCYPGNVLCTTEKYPVPSGMKNAIAYEVKKRTAQRLKALYPSAFLEELTALAHLHATNFAKELLWQEVETLQGTFDEERLERLESMVHYARSVQSLSDDEVERLLMWIRQERANMEDDAVEKDLFEKTMYGYAALQGGTLRYFTDARKALVCEKKMALELSGVFVTPVYQKTYWYNYSYRLADVVGDFQKKIRSVYDRQEVDKLQKIACCGKKTLAQTEINIIKKRTFEVYGTQAMETLTRYLNAWGLLLQG